MSDGPAFSNGTEFEMWSENWCSRCTRDTEDNPCDILTVALVLGDRPVEWLPQPSESYPRDAYHCVMFKGPDEPGGEPAPVPDPPDMDGLFERPLPRTRMFVRPQRQEVHR